MVGIFSRGSGGWGHNRTQSAIDVRTSSTPNIEEVSSVHAAVRHGFEEAVEFKPVEHPSEPMVYDQPITCPLPEPSIINDGRIWKQRRTSAARRGKADLPVVKDASGLESRDGSKPTPNPAKLHISSSLSAPEYSIISLLEECNSFQDRL
ncbi:uncharacterized protein LOC122033592 [Zingiber officinale]|uniref:Cystic fibrosis transmembrane conductance regulator n=1 Tax=Zingiber officinale TaxID=94328 RepID=A0A8J5ESV4_ZINOF|nr:uncharacterized protein LOC122033592 [Zingiber officinale]KAG6469019.1 hypothetical protein ZIOFF_073716 [Zingiber officinale]